MFEDGAAVGEKVGGDVVGAMVVGVAVTGAKVVGCDVGVIGRFYKVWIESKSRPVCKTAQFQAMNSIQ